MVTTIDFPLNSTLQEAVELLKQNLPAINIKVVEIEGDSPTIKLQFSNINVDTSGITTESEGK